MASPYSPLDSHAAVGPPHDRSSLPPRDFTHAASPPLVPMPERDDRGQHPYDQGYPGYDRNGYSDRPSYPPAPADGRPPYPDERGGSYYGSSRPPEDPYASHYGQPRRDYGDWPPRQDYYGRPPPPPADYYGRPPPGYPPQDPYGYPPRDPYGYPPRDPYYNAPPPPPRDPYQRDYYPPARHSTGPPPSATPAPPPVPQYGPPPDPNDLTIPLLYLARSVSLKTFTPLMPNYPNLSMRFVNSLLDLQNDLQAVSLEHPNLLGPRRRVWVTAVGGTDALVHRVRGGMTDVLDWREAGDIDELQRELAVEDRRVVVVREEAAEKARREEREASERRARDAQQAEMDRGRREIEERERDGAPHVKSEPQELDEVLRQVRGDAGAPLAEARANGDVGDRVEEVVRTDDTSMSESPSRARKRSRRDSDAEPDENHEAHRASRKKLEAVCKLERRRCGDWAAQNGVRVNEETQMVDEEPQLGERHKGVWDLFGEPLDDISPQIQVLMARALRDATYPPRLRLYDHPDALEQLQAAVPWFVTLLNTIKDRYELAGAASIVPQDPPLLDAPFAALPESTRNLPTLGSLSAVADTAETIKEEDAAVPAA
ncbi:hypothetical protein JCM10207_004029 [Rhodosporidiobolus poonsookiae]